jgi:hypothetical protein
MAVWLFERVDVHCRDQGFDQIGQLDVPSAHRRTIEIEAFTPEDPLHPMQRQVILPALDDGIGEKAGASDTAWNRKLRGLGHQHCGAECLTLALADELGFDHLDHNGRGRAPLDHFAALTADALEGI